MWIDTQNGKVIHSHAEARAARPNWGAPNQLTENMLNEQGFMSVQETPTGIDPAIQMAIELPPVFSGGVWRQAWRIVTIPSAQLEANLASLKEAAIAKSYADVDNIYDLAIGRRQSEYTEAEAAARAYMANPNAPVSGYVSGFAVDNPTGQVQSNLWSAQQIIGRADAFRAAQLAMRTVRFTAQKAMRASINLAQLDDANHDWKGFIERTRLTLGL